MFSIMGSAIKIFVATVLVFGMLQLEVGGSKLERKLMSQTRKFARELDLSESARWVSLKVKRTSLVAKIWILGALDGKPSESAKDSVVPEEDFSTSRAQR